MPSMHILPVHPPFLLNILTVDLPCLLSVTHVHLRCLQEFTIYVELAANGMFGTGTGIGPPDPNRYFKLQRAELALPCPTAWALYHDMIALKGLAREGPGSGTGACDDATSQQALYTANKVGRSSSIVTMYCM